MNFIKQTTRISKRLKLAPKPPHIIWYLSEYFIPKYFGWGNTNWKWKKFVKILNLFCTVHLNIYIRSLTCCYGEGCIHPMLIMKHFELLHMDEKGDLV